MVGGPFPRIKFPPSRIWMNQTGPRPKKGWIISMPFDTYPYELMPLPYPYDALEPYLDAEILHYHHDKHFGAYVNGLNAALKPYPKLQTLTLKQLLSRPERLPQKARTAILRNGGGVYNHTLYFVGLSPADQGPHEPQGILFNKINRTFSSFANFKRLFNQSALDVFGSGWTGLFLSPDGSLQIRNLKNQDTLLGTGMRPLLYVDVWEHAYYLQYKNLRAEYLQNIWNILQFPTL